MADFNDKTYWTCFGYEGEKPDDLHCTHKFLGKLSDEDAEEVEGILSDYFNLAPFESFTVAFTQEDFFGDDKEVRVLKPKKFDLEDFLPLLRKELDQFRKDDWPYSPHVSTDRKTVKLPFTRFCFCQGDKIIKEWAAE